MRCRLSRLVGKGHHLSDVRPLWIVRLVTLSLLFEDRWSELLTTIGANEPQSFTLAYPRTLLRDLASKAKVSFETLGLKAYCSGANRIAEV